MSADRFSAGKATDGLIHNCLKNGGRKIFLGGTLIDQRLNIGFCENTASGSNRIERMVILCVFV